MSVEYEEGWIGVQHTVAMTALELVFGGLQRSIVSRNSQEKEHILSLASPPRITLHSEIKRKELDRAHGTSRHRSDCKFR